MHVAHRTSHVTSRHVCTWHVRTSHVSSWFVREYFDQELRGLPSALLSKNDHVEGVTVR